MRRLKLSQEIATRLGLGASPFAKRRNHGQQASTVLTKESKVEMGFEAEHSGASDNGVGCGACGTRWRCRSYGIVGPLMPGDWRLARVRLSSLFASLFAVVAVSRVGSDMSLQYRIIIRVMSWGGRDVVVEDNSPKPLLNDVLVFGTVLYAVDLPSLGSADE